MGTPSTEHVAVPVGIGSTRISSWIVPAVSFSASGSGVHRIPEWAEIAVKDDVNFRIL